jgi:predicted amidohydrolase
MTRVTRVACCQLDPKIGDRAGNIERSMSAIAEAAAAGAQVIVLPELASSGYVFSSAAEARDSAEAADGPTLGAWRESTRRHGVTVVGGFCEWDPTQHQVFNSCVVLDRGELVCVYRKLHLWGEEQVLFSAGQAGAPVLDTSNGRLGVAICYDLEFPEVARGMALAGAQLLALPTNWPRSKSVPDGERPMLRTLAMATARLNRVFVAVCDRTGVERGLAFEGCSVIAGPDGWAIAEPVDPDNVQTLIADCELDLASDKRLGTRNDIIADRRPEFYATELRGDPSSLSIGRRSGEASQRSISVRAIEIGGGSRMLPEPSCAARRSSRSNQPTSSSSPSHTTGAPPSD